MTAAIEQDGTVRPLDARTAPDEVLTEQDVQDAPKLAKLLTRIRKDIATLGRRFAPRRIDYEDVEVSSSKAVMLHHGFGGRVRYWLADWAAAGGLPPVLSKGSTTDNDTLVLDAYQPVVIYLPSAFTTTLATAQDTLLTFPVRSGEVWLVEVWAFGGSSTVNGMKYAIGAPTGSTVDGYLDSSSTTEESDQIEQITAINTLTAAVHVTAGGTRPDYINARLSIAASGSVTIQAASTTGGDTTTIRSFACLRAVRMRAGASTYVPGKATIAVEEAG